MITKSSLASLDYPRLILIALLLKGGILGYSATDVFICLGLTGLIGLQAFLTSLKPTKHDMDADLRKELDGIKSTIAIMKIERSVQAKPRNLSGWGQP